MLYPEYPSYANTEKRIKSFSLDWTYPSGSRLSNQMMAEAGFFNMGGGSVCCYYCGNKLQNFEPRYIVFFRLSMFFIGHFQRLSIRRTCYILSTL